MSQLQRDLRKIDSNRRFDSMFMLLRKKYTEARKPLSGMFELTSHCTLNCKMCYIHPSTGTVNKPRISTREWLGVMDQAVSAGMLYATLTGGECFTHPGFREIYEFLYDSGVKVSIKTNGTLIDEDAANWLAKRKPQDIRITLYGSNPEVYKRVTGVGAAFHRANRAIDLLVEREISTDISLTVIQQNVNDIEAIIALAKSRRIGRTMIDSTIISPRLGVDNDALGCAIDYSKKVEMWKLNLESINMQVYGLCDLDLLASKLPRQSEENVEILRGMSCAAGMCKFHITSEGVMQPCVEYPLENAFPFETSFDDAWRVVNEAAHAYRRTQECLDCAFLGYCSFCPSRYALMTGGYGHPKDRPCDKREMTIPLMLGFKEDDIHEEGVFETDGCVCPDEL